jgi:hypothetical protein
MNALSIFNLVNDLFEAFEVIFPKAQTLAHVAAITNIVGASVVAANPDPGTINPTVAALHANLPAVVSSVQAIRASIAANPVQ